ncbi:MAG: hypothetical protein OXC07_03675 [Kistimonas sp.]|nr:hypothetical protein [Kistimonas sp.]
MSTILSSCGAGQQTGIQARPEPAQLPALALMPVSTGALITLSTARQDGLA